MKKLGQRQRVETYAKGKSLPGIDLDHPDLNTAIQFARLSLYKDNPGVRAMLLQTFFERSAVTVKEDRKDENFIDGHLKRIAIRYEKEIPSAEDLVQNCFTQNPSPARLVRIWGATNDFLVSWIDEIHHGIFAEQPQRLRFATIAAVAGVRPRQTYRSSVPGLTPGPLMVLCLDESRREFLTVDSLDKFQCRNGDRRLFGREAVQSALEWGGIEDWREDETGERVAEAAQVDKTSFRSESYLPFIVLAQSSVFCQLLLPAIEARSVLSKLLDMSEVNFGKVQGKLPLHVGLLVTNRRFPLYALIEAGQQVLDHRLCQNGAIQQPWWDTQDHASDPFYGYYPTATPGNDGGYALADLAPVDRAKPFWMTTGYFDFDFLGSTADRHLLTYDEYNGKPVRPSVTYGHLRPRPLPMPRLHNLIEVWDILSTHLGTTQRHHLHEALATKLEEWKTVGQEVRPAFEGFGKALIRDSFGTKWQKLSDEQRRCLHESAVDGMLLEALELFQHVVKERS